MSTDYEKLWSLINKGYRIPAWVYNEELKAWIIREINEESRNWLFRPNVFKHHGYYDCLEEFIIICKEHNLHYVEPTTPIQTDNSFFFLDLMIEANDIPPEFNQIVNDKL